MLCTAANRLSERLNWIGIRLTQFMNMHVTSDRTTLDGQEATQQSLTRQCSELNQGRKPLLAAQWQETNTGAASQLRSKTQRFTLYWDACRNLQEEQTWISCQNLLLASTETDHGNRECIARMHKSYLKVYSTLKPEFHSDVLWKTPTAEKPVIKKWHCFQAS